MTDDRSLERAARSFIEAGPTQAPDRAVEAALLLIETTSQERDLRVPWRIPSMTTPARVAVAAVIGVLLVGAAVYYFGGPGQPGVGGPPQPSPSPSLPPSASPTSSSAAEAPIDTADWVVYDSERYGFSISHPADWTVQPATRDWTFEADAPDWLSNAQEVFVAPDQAVRVSVWSLEVEPGTSAQAWIQAYCAVATEPCSGIQDRAVAAYAEPRDRHPGVLVPFTNDVQAFFLNGDRMFVVACWRPDSDVTVEQYGGSMRLVEAMALSMTLGTPAPAAATPAPS